jgi:NAD(P)-dependent dehydrogenase (short-subunit alcohol dehydrogenase family)
MSLTQHYDFHGKTALITGASGGLGEQFARCLHARGARVLLASRREDKLKNLSDELGNAKAIKMDVADKNSVISCFSELEAAGEKIDICINNAGIAKLTPIFEEEQNDDFESLIQTNLMGVWYVTKAVANHMKSHNIHGSIINIASINGEAFPYKEATGYAISKAAVIHMSKSLVTELSPYKIRINSISPGLFRTPMTAHKVGTEEQQKEFANLIPLGFVASPQDLDSALMFLAHNEHSAYITGTNITVDGGKSWGVTSW